MKSKQQMYYQIEKLNMRLPLTIIEGAKDGKTMLFSAGIHGCEYDGIEALKELANEMDPAKVTGKIICIHRANPSGFTKKAPAIVPEDEENLNRVFPGDENGSFSYKLAHVITTEFQDKADYYVDLHGGDQHEDTIPFVYFPGEGDESIVEVARTMAKALRVSYRVKSTAKTGAYNSAALRGIPSILIERGGKGNWSQEEVQDYKNDLNNILFHFGFLEDRNHALSHSLIMDQKELTKVNYINAPASGTWYPKIQKGDIVFEGDLFGILCDPFGNTIEKIYAKEKGVILYMTVSYSIEKDESLIAQGVL